MIRSLIILKAYRSMMQEPRLGYASIQSIVEELERRNISYRDISAYYSRTSKSLVINSKSQSGENILTRIIEFDRDLKVKSDREIKPRFDEAPKNRKFFGKGRDPRLDTHDFREDDFGD